MDKDFKALLEGSSLGTSAARQIRSATSAAVVDDVRRRMNRSPQENPEPEEYIRRILDRMEPSRPTADTRKRRASRFLLTLAGAVPEIVDKTPGERVRFESLGGAVLITSGMATVSMWFALTTALGVNGLAATLVSVMWGLVIMGIDRWLIASMPTDGRRKFALAVPRLLLALLLGALISTPLVLRIFQPEINAQIAVMKQQSYSSFLQQQQVGQLHQQVTTYSSEIQQLNTVIASHGAATGNTAADPELVAYNNQLTQYEDQLSKWTSLKNHYYTAYTCQKYGGPQCPAKGDGVAEQASYSSYRQAAQQATSYQEKISQVQGQIRERDQFLSSTSEADQQQRYQEALNQRPLVQEEYDTAVQRTNALQASFSAEENASNGILIRLEALSQLSSNNDTVNAARWLLFLLFLVIECLPLTVKLLQSPGQYEKILARELDKRLKITLIQEGLQRQHPAAGQEEQRMSAATQDTAPAQAPVASTGGAGPTTVPDNLKREIESIYQFRGTSETPATPGYDEQIENLFFAISPAINELLRNGYTTDQVIEALHIAADMLIPYLEAARQAALASGK